MAKVEKLLKRFRIVYDDQNFYEAHQVARTIYYRWLELSEYEKLSDFLAEKVLEFVKVDEPMIAFDLTDLYAKTLIQANAPVDNSRLGQIEKLITAISALELRATDQKPSSNPMLPIVTQLINWSTESSSASLIERQYGDACLNLIFAKAFESNNQLDFSKKHYICSKDPKAYAQFVLQHFDQLSSEREDKDSEDLSKLEDDTVLALVVLQVLAIGRLGTATKLLYLLTEKHNKYSPRPPYKSALLNFTWLLTFCVQLKSMEYFTDLAETYKPTFSRDSRLIHLVDKVGQKFFGVPEKERSGFGGGLLGNLLKGMSSKKEIKPVNPLDFEADDSQFLGEYKITDQGFHSAWEAAAKRNPPNSCVEPQFSDAYDEPQAPIATKSSAQSEMDLD